MARSWHRFPLRSTTFLGCLLAGLAVATVAQNPVQAATISVGGGCTLVDAILAANSDSASGGCPAGSGPDTLELTGDVVLSSIYSSEAGLPTVLSTITIEGRGWTIERAGGTPDFRIVRVVGSGVLTLRQVTIENGRAYSDSAAIAAHGGCIINFATLELVDSTIKGCQAAADGSSARGAGIYSGSGSTLVVTNSTIHVNQTWSSTNEALGGGIFVSGGSLTITNSTLSGNNALNASSTGAGGGLHKLTGLPSTITNVTFSGNAANTGAALVADSSITVRGSIFGNGLISGNCAGGATELVDGGENQADDNSCATIPDTLTGLDPVARDNGGPTLTHALLDGSSAISGAPTCGLAEDQRGAPRGDVCDSGAFEWGGCPVLVLSDDTVDAEEIHESCQIKAGPDYCVVGPSGDLTLRAGRDVELGDGFCVGADGVLTVEIDGDLIP